MVGRSDLVEFPFKAAGILDMILEDPAVFPDGDGPLSLGEKMNLLGMRYRRFLRFKSVTDHRDRACSAEEALLCIHFLVDVDLAKREVGQ